jgi:hypothetical protein
VPVAHRLLLVLVLGFDVETRAEGGTPDLYRTRHAPSIASQFVAVLQWFRERLPNDVYARCHSCRRTNRNARYNAAWCKIRI